MQNQGGTQSTNANTGFGSGTHLHVDNISNFSEQYNDLGLNTFLDSYSVKQELIRLANQNYQEKDVKKLNERIADLETTLDINKSLIQTLMQPPSDSTENEVFKKLTDENNYIKKRLKQVYQDNDALLSKNLLLEQMNADSKVKEHMITRQLEETIDDLNERLEKKEHYMQQKEKKWMEIEEIMIEYAQDDDEL